MAGSRRAALHAAALLALCIVTYFTGLTSVGLVNWQESQRVLVAREMQQRAQWLVPTVHGRPYIAKPPMMYWAQIALAELRGGTVDERDLRAVVAIAGTLGVLATYFVAGRMLAGWRHTLGCERVPESTERLTKTGETPVPPIRETRSHFDHAAAWWSALGLAVGVLYVRSARTGELDILLVPSVVIAVGAIHAAWSHAERTQRTHYGALALAALAAVAAALTKGPPALAAIFAGGYAPMLVRGAMMPCAVKEPALPWVAALIVAPVCMFFGAAFWGVHDWTDAVGVLMLGAIGGAAVWVYIRAMVYGRPRVVWTWNALMRTHPLLVLGAGALAAWWWARSVSERIGAQALSDLALAEVEDNLRILVPQAPFQNMGFMAYGLAPASIAMIACLIWLGRERVRLPLGVLMALVWVLCGFVLFSVLGKGVGRYLTPLWPGVAMLGGLWITSFIRDRHARAPWLGPAVGTALVLCGTGQGWWYGAGRAALNAKTSPRDMLREVGPAIDGLPAHTMNFQTAAMDYYLGREVTDWGRGAPAQRDAEALVRHLLAPGSLPAVVFEVPAPPRRDGEPRPPIEELAREAGLRVSAIEHRSVYQRPSETVPVRAWRIE